MGRYFYLQCKRLSRSLPGALCVIVVLCLCLGLVFSMIMSREKNREENTPFQIAITGQTDDLFFQLGLQTIEALDSSRFSLEILTLSEQEAQTALQQGKIAAYAIIPDGFMDAAFSGQIIPIRFVSTVGNSTMVSVFKDEVTRMITQMVSQSQKGTFGLGDALSDQGLRVGGHMDQLAFQYVDYILLRDRVYTLRELGIADQLNLQDYLLCGLSVLFLWLSCLAFAPKLLHPDPALGQLLRSRGKPMMLQRLCEFGAYWLMLLPIGLLPIIGALCMNLVEPSLWLLPAVLTVTLLCAAMSFFLYRLTTQLLSGVLVQFFAAVAMCFVCGCMYPVFFFPEGLQRLAAWLPAGLARSLLAGCITGELSPGAYLAALGYSSVFLALSGWKEGI